MLPLDLRSEHDHDINKFVFSLKRYYRSKPNRASLTFSQTSLIRTPKGQNQASILRRCPYYRGRECMIFRICGTKQTVRNREVSVL